MPGKRKSSKTKVRAAHSSAVKPVDVERLAALQGVVPVTDPADLVSDFWPEDESIDDFMAAVRRWRHEGKEP